MPMVVKNNMAAITTLNTLNKNSNSLTKSLGKVSTGMRINGAADDASGYAISERMRVQIRSLDQDNRNAQNGSSMMKVAEGAVNSTIEILKTLKEKVINAANDTNTDSDRATIQKELDQSIDQIDDNANVNYNGKYLLDGSKNNKMEASYTHLTNQNLSTDTTGATKLTDLASRAGDALQLQKTDNITVSYVQQGKTYKTTFQVGDKTLQDIFNEAENIDSNTKTFASNDNKSVSEVTGNSAVNSEAAAVKNAVAALRATLGHKAGTIASNAALEFATAPTDETIANGNVSFTLQGTGTIATYNSSTNVATTDGDLYSQLEKASNEANTSYKVMTNLGSALKTALDNNNISWDSGTNFTNSAELRTKTFQDQIANADDTTKQAYNDYVKAADTFAANKANAESLLGEYNDKAAQLDALMLEDAYYDSRKAYERGVDNMLSNLQDVATSQTAEKFSYVNSKGETVESPALDKSRGDFVKTMVADLREQLMNINPGTTTNKNQNTEAANTIISNVKFGGTKAINADDTVSGTNGGAYKALGSSAAAIVNEAKDAGYAVDMDGALNAMIDAENANGNKVGVVLEKAHADALKAYTSPTLLTGNKIGLDGTGKMHSTASGENALTIVAANNGVDGQISGFTIGIKDSQGNARKSAEAALDAFDESIRGQNASADNSINLQIGTKANQTITVGLTDMRSQALGLKGSDGSTLNIGNRDNANAAINVLDNALAKVLDQATTIGAVQSRLEYTSSNLTTSSENVTASESTIRDADMAKEMTEYTKNNVLLQAAQSMLSQANQNSSAVLSLLQ